MFSLKKATDPHCIADGRLSLSNRAKYGTTITTNGTQGMAATHETTRIWTWDSHSRMQPRSHNRPRIPCPNKTGRGIRCQTILILRLYYYVNSYCTTLILELTKVSITFVSCSRRVWCAISYFSVQNWNCTHIVTLIMYSRRVLVTERWYLMKKMPRVTFKNILKKLDKFS